MKKAFILIWFCLLAICTLIKGYGQGMAQDTNTVIKLNKQGFDNRMNNPDQTVSNATKALAIAQKLNYKPGIGESYRVMGIGYYYLNQPLKSIDNFLVALDFFQKIKDLRSEGKVYNGIGNLYRDNDYDLSLEYFQKALVIAKKLSDNKLIAPIYLNIGNVYYRKNSFTQALNYYDKSNVLYAALKDTVNLIQCLQNKGVMYYNLNQYDKAERLLLEANREAKQLDLNITVASIDLTFADIYIAQNKFKEAERSIREGLTCARIIKNDVIESDFIFTSYQLELKRKNYKAAVYILKDIYHKDSVIYKENSKTQINVKLEQVKQQARQKENEFLLERQKYDLVKFWGVAIVAGLLMVLVGLLISNVKRKAKTNEQLTNLNAEVSRQKDNLDRINHHLEEIIDERTKDLQVKNKKLSEYSSYLSHQIRGPIATLKGLMNLEKEGLVDQAECIKMMNKCVGEIDNKIIEMSDMLHDPVKTSL
ncbi:tetratricopeptide repeat protein [Mucilaginibacter sp. OK098]|uniref:tetratricopeptide repeat protein n=1 Tax=Mucilaginibacter sp. OK098 TaxID=1855297 RepID=UPI0009187B48|nr:tetratricopeptide repeat protein [Mucilaginibacter sp. OK098]SHN28472.1 Tetratricopeptide repeat-containing protein [Mucilaginibacter sp. OK098]